MGTRGVAVPSGRLLRYRGSGHPRCGSSQPRLGSREEGSGVEAAWRWWPGHVGAVGLGGMVRPDQPRASASPPSR